MGVIKQIGTLLRALLANRAALTMETLALRQQPAVLERSVKRPALQQRDRIFWAWLSRLWNGCPDDEAAHVARQEAAECLLLHVLAQARKLLGYVLPAMMPFPCGGRRSEDRVPVREKYNMCDMPVKGQRQRGKDGHREGRAPFGPGPWVR